MVEPFCLTPPLPSPSVITFEYALDFLSVSEGDKNVEICVNKIGRTTLRLAVGVLSSANTSEGVCMHTHSYV